jgi:uncharacterized membrane protein
MFTSLVFWSSVSGLVFLIAGLVLIRKELAAASGLDKVIVLGYAFVAAPLATFGTEHLLSSRAIMQMVPSWIPAPLFWTYFVGIGLFAAAASFVARKQLRWSALLLAIMFFIFVLTMDIPAVIQQPKERLSWTLMLRETAFGGGALALAGWARQENARLSKALIAVGRICVAAALIFYGVEHFVFARNAPGVPLEKMTPNWVPVPQLWAYAVGALLLIAGAAMLFNWRTQMAAAWVGAVMTFITLFLYFPIYLQELGTPLGLEGLNYIGDTLLFGGVVLFVAIAVTPSRRQVGNKLTEFPEVPSDVRLAQR